MLGLGSGRRHRGHERERQRQHQVFHHRLRQHQRHGAPRCLVGRRKAAMQRFDPLQVPNRAVPLDRLPVAGQARRGAVAMEVGRSQPTGMAFDHDDVEGLGGVFDLGAAMKTMIAVLKSGVECTIN